ncbi:MAG TPA: hypothetical protein VEL76_01835 [Gemmataceae bacterium]|nr:hypothetical protein [Gemmataceae bacterium]
MSASHCNPPAPPAEAPFRYARAETARHLADAQDARAGPPVGRHAARAAGIPHTTLRYWRQRQRRTAAPAALVAFFDSPEGLAFLKRLLLAVHLVFQQNGTAGLRPLCRFLELAQLAPFVAASYGTHQRLATLLQDLLAQYDQEQRQRLAPNLPAKAITLCEDANFHGAQPCLVAIEPVSNFLVLETYQPQRDAATWNAAVQAALQGLPVTVVQVTSDLAKGLQAHAKDGLGVHHSPDLMHVQADLHKRGTSRRSTAWPRQLSCPTRVGRRSPKPGACCRGWWRRWPGSGTACVCWSSHWRCPRTRSARCTSSCCRGCTGPRRRSGAGRPRTGSGCVGWRRIA